MAVEVTLECPRVSPTIGQDRLPGWGQSKNDSEVSVKPVAIHLSLQPQRLLPEVAMTSFTGGEAMEKKLAEIARKVGNGTTIKVGFLDGETYPDGATVPMVAAANEFGDPSANRPPRPFIRNMIAEKSPEWPDDISKILIATDYDGRATFSLMGERIKGQMQESIRNISDPPLAPSTVAKKGFDKPLIDTSVMINAVDYQIEEHAAGSPSLLQRVVNFFKG